MSSDEPQRIKCNRCKMNLTVDKFKMKRDDTYMKGCMECNQKDVEWRKNNRCEHGKNKSACKACGGSQICKHGRMKQVCKDCKGVSICEHNRVRSTCKDCKGSDICQHNRRQGVCRECNGSQMCEHGRRRIMCRDCGGSQICSHDRRKDTCRDCGGSQICEHDRIKNVCRECEGSRICVHGIQKPICRVCDPIGHLSSVVRRSVRSALKSSKSKPSIEYLGCEIEEFKEHIESKFKEGMSWENYGEWHIDHIVPLRYQNPSIEEVMERLHWENTQPLWASENIAKGNRFIG